MNHTSVDVTNYVKSHFMPRTLIFAIVLASIPTMIRAQNTPTPAPSAIVKTYCVSCHSGQAPAGRLSLDQINPPAGDSETWERVVRQLRARTMPPMAAPRPDSRTYESTICINQHAGSCCRNHHIPVKRYGGCGTPRKNDLGR